MLKNRSTIAISLGAIAGAWSRYYLTDYVKCFVSKDAGFIATFWINIIGCVLIAYLLTLAADRVDLFSPEVKLMLTTGFCGSFTTFSTYELDMQIFIDRGNICLLLIYALGSAIGGIISIQFGTFLARLKI
jgi:fluoride exporter